MDMILTKITHSIDSNKRDSYIYAVTLMGLFTFLFLGVEYFCECTFAYRIGRSNSTGTKLCARCQCSWVCTLRIV